jgi:hypothetical protein
MLIVLLLAPIRPASAAKSVLQASATTDTDLKSRIVKVQTTLVAGPGFGPIFGLLARIGVVFGIGGFGPPQPT